MPIPYPLKPVICSQPRLAQRYDTNPASIDLISACLTPLQLADLLDQGASFDTILFLNGEGEELGQRLSCVADDDALRPALQTLCLDPMDADAVSAIHAAFGQQRAKGFFVAGG